MKKNSIADYSSYILFRALAFFIRRLPRGFCFFLGRRIGDLLYYFDKRHKAIAYSNIKVAFGKDLSPSQLNKLTHKFYRAFAQNFIEVFFLPFIDKKYLDKYIRLEGLNFVDAAFKKGKGVIFVSVHAGSWELSNFLCARVGIPFTLYVREQRMARLNKLLNSYRKPKGYSDIKIVDNPGELIRALKNNAAIGVTADQGGKDGVLVKFFGRSAAMATAAIRLALKYDSVILPVFYARIKGPYLKVIVDGPFKILRTENPEQDVQENLQRLISVFERYILQYPQEYLWTYKIFKYGNERSILVLSDGKAGHLRQAQAVADIATQRLKEKGIATQVENIEIKFKHKIARTSLMLSSILSGKYHCQGCLWCLRTFLEKDNYASLIRIKPDIIISCGSSLAPINYVLARENLAKSIVIMRPSILGLKKFDLVIMPRHDRPPKRKNVVATDGALTRLTAYLPRRQAGDLRPTAFYIGLLIGGDTKKFRLPPASILGVVKQIKSAAEKLNSDILITTSRRTSKEIEGLVKKEFLNYPRAKMLVIANENNPAPAMSDILGLSSIIVASPESISMICEAVSSGKYVLVFKSAGLGLKHQRFLKNFSDKKYIYLTEVPELAQRLEEIWRSKPKISAPRDDILVSQAISRIL